MMDRSERWKDDKNLISGFDPRAYHYEKSLEDISRLIKGKVINLPAKILGDRVGRKDIEPAKVLILDGTPSFFDDFYPLSDFSVYFHANDFTRYILSTWKDTQLLGYSLIKSWSKFEVHSTTYQRFIEAFRDRADVEVMIDCS
jgi:uridine kinase